MGDHQRRPIDAGDGVGHSESLAGTGDAHEGLEFLIAGCAVFVDGLCHLIALGLEGRDYLELCVQQQRQSLAAREALSNSRNAIESPKEIQFAAFPLRGSSRASRLVLPARSRETTAKRNKVGLPRGEM